MVGGGAVGGLLGVAVMVGGGKLVSAIISNPDSARALKTVLSSEASRLVKRQAMTDALRAGLFAMAGAGDIKPFDFPQYQVAADYAVEAFWRQVEEYMPQATPTEK